MLPDPAGVGYRGEPVVSKKVSKKVSGLFFPTSGGFGSVSPGSVGLRCVQVCDHRPSAMPRYPRLFLPDIPLHIVHRGHDRKPVFVEPADYRYYLDNLVELKSELNIEVFGYCLMTNHVHLIMVPGDRVENISRLMRVVAARQTRRINKLESRSGTLWEGRFKASLIDSDAYLLACYRYVDLNPVRAAIVADPIEYPWSSYRSHADPAGDDWLDKSPTYQSLGHSGHERARAYRAFVSGATDADEIQLIRGALQRNQVTGTDHFRRELEHRTGRRLFSRRQGRPRLEK